MPTCRTCGDSFPVEELVRHVSATRLVVHCPSCHGPMGRYRRHAGRAEPADRS